MPNTFQVILKNAIKSAKKRGYDMYIIANENVTEFSFSQSTTTWLTEGESYILVVTPEGLVKHYIEP